MHGMGFTQSTSNKEEWRIEDKKVRHKFQVVKADG